MAILNITPDSFSDGGKYLEPFKAVEQAVKLQTQGANILDIGAESTRPGSQSISTEEELYRLSSVLPQILGNITIPISIDTSKPQVAKECLQMGAGIINDVSGLENPEMRQIIAEYGCPVVLMHRHPIKNQACPEILAYFEQQVKLAYQDGIKEIILDPGFGFGKTPQQNWEILNHLSEIRIPNCRLLIGTSRKSFRDGVKKYITKETVEVGIKMGADIVRVHEPALIRS